MNRLNESGEIFSIRKYFDDINCLWKTEITIVIPKEQTEFKVGKCQITQ